MIKVFVTIKKRGKKRIVCESFKDVCVRRRRGGRTKSAVGRDQTWKNEKVCSTLSTSMEVHSHDYLKVEFYE